MPHGDILHPKGPNMDHYKVAQNPHNQGMIVRVPCMRSVGVCHCNICCEWLDGIVCLFSIVLC